jgi:GNAT superfamily N-acetyltransferase
VKALSISRHAIRHATPQDAAEIARLLTVLEHPTTEAEVTQWWPSWREHGIWALVAERDDASLAAFCQLHMTHVLHRPKPVGRITALVVDIEARGQLLGSRLVAVAEAELAARGCGLLEITSNRRRTDAHRFYERLGYEHTSVRLSRTIAD